MSQNVCKKCHRPLPEGYKAKRCESCLSKQAGTAKKAIVPILGTILTTAVAIATKGNINLGKK